MSNGTVLSDKTIANMMEWIKCMEKEATPSTKIGKDEDEYPDPPYIGQKVHYLSRGSADGVFLKLHRAAIVTDIGSNTMEYAVSLFVMNPDGCYFNHMVEFDESASIGGTWHYIEEEQR